MPTFENRDTDSGKIDVLDSLRGLAALIVLFAHTAPVYLFRPSPHGPTPLVDLWHSHSFPVRLFFVLSGFVLSLAYLRTGDPATLRSAAIRRYFRLVVPILGSVVLVYLLLMMGLISPILVPRFQSMGSAIDAGFDSLLDALYRSIFAFDYERTYNRALWTMSPEFFGSLFVFALLGLFGSMRNRWLIFTVIGGFLLIRGETWFVDFLAGLMLAVAVGPNARANGGWKWSAVVLIALVMADVTRPWLERHGLGRLANLGLDYWSTIASAMLILATLRWRGLNRCLSAPPFVFFGRISFGLYLLHIPVILVLHSCVFVPMIEAGWHWKTAGTATSMTAWVASVLLGAAASRTLDPWGIRLGKAVDRWLFLPRGKSEPIVLAFPGTARRAAA
jgi:peptidoglycan/LPS O-acetylase OafA/YrhL